VDEEPIKVMVMKFSCFFIAGLMMIVLHGQTGDSTFEEVVQDFERGYESLDVPGLGLSYVSNLQQINTLEELEEQRLFFQKYERLLKPFSETALSEEDQLTYAVLRYEIDLNLERIGLECKWLEGGYAIQETRIFDEAMGKQWYAYYLKKWVDKGLAPDAAYQFGLEEIAKVKQNMEAIPARMGMDESAFKQHLQDSTYFLTDNDVILAQYDALRKKIRTTAKGYFPDVDQVPEVSIAVGTDERMAIAPAYYHNNTFYYNFFDGSYNSRDMGWIFLHEAIPGHHYQGSIAATLAPSVRDRFWYAGYVEGWGAYIEQFGNELGAYDSPMDAYGQLEWDLIRSVRVALDVALNYYGWTDEQALEFWNQHIADKEDIARREIKRMKRWPAQVITYKYGKSILDELKGDRNTPEALKAFHREVLACGVVPVSVLKNHIQGKGMED
jgi:uncharacterized protein (DUF885 family)